MAELADIPALVPVLALRHLAIPFGEVYTNEHAIAGGPTMWFMWREPVPHA